MNNSAHIEKWISFFLFLGLLFYLFFIYFEQERLYNQLTTGSITLGSEKYLRIASVVLIFLTVFLSIFSAKSKYNLSIFIAYLILFVVVTINFIVSGADLFDMTQVMSNRGIGTWVCLGLIFVGYHDGRYRFFQKFVLFSILFISALTIYNLIDFGVGHWRGQAMSKYQIYAVNMVWMVPYIFLILKDRAKLKFLRFFVLFMGIILALVCQTRSFLIIYLITLIFDFYNTKKKSSYVVVMAIGFLGLGYLILNTLIFSSSLDLLMNRGANDTRSEQLLVFIGQLNFFEIITGGGFFKSYRYGNSQWFAVDNQWLFLLWWGGLVPVLCYFYLTAIVPIKTLFKGKLSYETKVECFVLIIWVLGLTGLAIFSTMSINFYFYIICIILSRVLYKFSAGIQ